MARSGRLTVEQQAMYDSLPEGALLRRLYELGAGMDAHEGAAAVPLERIGARVEFRGRLDRYKEADGRSWLGGL